MTCIPEQRYRKRWLCRVSVPVAGATLLIFIKYYGEPALKNGNIQEKSTSIAHTGVNNNPITLLNHDTAPEQSDEGFPRLDAPPVCDMKEPAVPDEVKERGNLSQNDESNHEEQIYAEQRENYFPGGIHTAYGLVQFLTAVVCLVISCAVLVCVEKLCRVCRKYGLAALAIVLAISAFAQFIVANINFNKQGATIDRQIAALEQSNWEIVNIATQLKEKGQLIGNMTIKIEMLNISLKEQRDFATKQDEMHKNHVEMLEERCIERINELKDDLTRTVIAEKDEMKRNISQSDTSVQMVKLAQQKEIAYLSIKVKELNQSEQRQQSTIESKNHEIESKNQEIRSKNQEIESKKQEIWSKNQEIESKNQEIWSKNQEIESKKQEYDGKLNTLKAKCTVWQLTKDYISKILDMK